MKEAKTRTPSARPWLTLFLLFGLAGRALAQDSPPQPPVSPAILSKLFEDSEKAFGAKDYGTATSKLTELLKLCNNKPEYPLEFLMFNLGLAYLLDGKAAEAEKAFAECAKRFPKGEYASRCQLGLGKAALAQGGEEKRKLAAEALDQAAKDPRYRAEATLPLMEFYFDTRKEEKARETLRTSMSSEVRTQQQVSAAVDIVGVLATSGRLDDLTDYLAYLGKQPGVQDSIAWYSNQIVVKADVRMDAGGCEAALAIYQTLLSRAKILEIQRASMESQRKELARMAGEKQAAEKRGTLQGTAAASASEAISTAQAALKLNERALATIVGMEDFDASMLGRRGRGHYYLKHLKEALECFATIREKYPESIAAEDAAYSEIAACNELGERAKVQELADAFTAKYPGSLNLPKVAELKEKAAK